MTTALIVFGIVGGVLMAAGGLFLIIEEDGYALTGAVTIALGVCAIAASIVIAISASAAERQACQAVGGTELRVTSARSECFAVVDGKITEVHP